VVRLVKIKEWVDVHDPHSAIIPFSGSLEAKLVEMDDDERTAYLKDQQTTRYSTQSLVIASVRNFILIMLSVCYS